MPSGKAQKTLLEHKPLASNRSQLSAASTSCGQHLCRPAVRAMSFRRAGSMSMPTSPQQGCRDGVRTMQERRDQVKPADIAWVRQELGQQASQECTDAQINRFVRAANFNREQVMICTSCCRPSMSSVAASLFRLLRPANILALCTQTQQRALRLDTLSISAADIPLFPAIATSCQRSGTLRLIRNVPLQMSFRAEALYKQ